MKQSRNKKSAVFFLGLVFFSLNALAQQAPFVYDDHGRHDPFAPLVTPAGSMITYDTDLSMTDLVVEGIVADSQGNNAAIINGKIVAAGDALGAYSIDKINVDGVEVSKGEQHLEIKVKKEKGGL